MKEGSALEEYKKKCKVFMRKLKKLEAGLKKDAKEHLKEPINRGYLGVFDYYMEQLDVILDTMYE